MLLSLNENIMSNLCIILPVYNGEKTIRKTIESLLGQSYIDFNLFVCIDGTNDGSRKIIESFADERIKIYENEYNIGLARTLNKLMMLLPSDTKYVAMAEQDDYYYPNRLQDELDFLESNNKYGMVSGIAEFWNGKSATLFPGILANGGGIHKIEMTSSGICIENRVRL